MLAGTSTSRTLTIVACRYSTGWGLTSLLLAAIVLQFPDIHPLYFWLPPVASQFTSRGGRGVVDAVDCFILLPFFAFSIPLLFLRNKNRNRICSRFTKCTPLLPYTPKRSRFEIQITLKGLLDFLPCNCVDFT